MNKLSEFLIAFTKKDFIKNIGVMLSGTMLAQIINISVTPILSRQFSPEAFGILGIIMAIISVMATLATGRYNLAVMLPKSENDSKTLLFLSLFIATVFSLIITAIILFTNVTEILVTNTHIHQYLLIIPILLLFLGFNQTLEVWLSRKKLFSKIAIALIAGAILGNGFKLIFGLYSDSELGLIIGNTIALSIPPLIYLYFERNIFLRLGEFLHIETVFTLARNYKYLPIFRSTKDFVNSLSQQIPIFMFALFFSVTQVGLYVLANRLMRLPLLLIGEAVKKVFYQKAADLFNSDHHLLPALLKTQSLLIVIGIIPFAFVWFYGPSLFQFILGNEWNYAGEYARWISIWMFFGFVAMPTVVLIPILKREKFFFVFELVSIMIRTISLFIGGYILKNDIYSVMLFSLVSAGINIAVIGFVIRDTIRHQNNNLTATH